MNQQRSSAQCVDLTSLVVPGPTPNELSAPFWAAAAEGRLSLQRCLNCRQFSSYPREICPLCWSSNFAWGTVSGMAKVETFTRVHRAGNAGWQLAAPYVVALVRLLEGPVLLSQLLGGKGVRRGSACHMEPTRVGEWTLPFFRLSDQALLEPANGRAS